MREKLSKVDFHPEKFIRSLKICNTENYKEVLNKTEPRKRSFMLVGIYYSLVPSVLYIILCSQFFQKEIFILLLPFL